MIPNVRSAVSALSYSLIREECDERERRAGFPHNRVVRFVLEQQRSLAGFLRLPMLVLVLLFDAEAIARAGRPFHRLPHERRWRQIQRWRASRLPLRAEFIRFHQALVLYGWHASIDERAPDR